MHHAQRDSKRGGIEHKQKIELMGNPHAQKMEQASKSLKTRVGS